MSPAAAIRYNRPMPPTMPIAADTQRQIWTVSQLTRRVKATLEDVIGEVWVAGELSNFRVSPAGHSYFTLKDENSQLAAVMFKGRLSTLKFEPENGLEVIIRGSITVYEPRGNYQIICEDMQPKGIGALQLAFEKLKKKLAEEGLFDESHKKPLPLLPQRIGIVTSPTGAAIRDILNVINRRYANVHVILYPARVQGDEAKAEIVAGIQALDAWGVDVMIVGRGGGSLEDLWAFNEEPVVRAIYNAQTPIISAVGHETDITLSDFAADLRAPTPSAAAELVVQEHEALLETVNQLRARLARGLRASLNDARNRLDRLQSSYVFRRPEELTRQQRQQCDELRMRMDNAIADHERALRIRLNSALRSLALLSPANQLSRSRERWASLRARLLRVATLPTEDRRRQLLPLLSQLDSLSPLAVLARGYAIVRREDDGQLVLDADKLSHGDRLSIRFHRGETSVKVDTSPDE